MEELSRTHSAGTPGATSGPEGGQPERDAERPLVLVVDDEPSVLRSITSVLEKRFRVVTAADGEEGLAAALALVPDLIVTDLMMPRMTGEQLVHEVRKREALAGVAVVLLTAVNDEEMRLRVLRDGAIDYITKPFSTRELVSRVQNFVELKRARALLARELDCRNRDVETMAKELVARKRELEAALEVARQERDRAARASEAKSDLLRLVSHELRTPVAALRLIGQQLERDRRAPLPPEHLHRVRRILALVDRLSSEIDALLEHVRLESGRPDVHEDTVDLAALAADVLEALRPEAAEKGLEVRVATDPDVEPVQADRRLLRLVLSNLAANAVKFTDAGSVTVTIRRRDREVRVAVSDTGPGIAPADQPRAFEPFEQLEPLQHKHKPGLGLGLALARQAATSLGGRIELESVEGQGSTFTLVLRGPEQAARDAARPGAPAGAGA